MPDVRWTTMLPDLTVLTANVGNGQSPDERLIAAILASKADIVGLQELNRRQAAVLQERLTDVYPERFAFADSYEGQAIFSRYPVDSAWPMTLVPGRPDCAARIDLGGREITVIVAHPRPPRIQRRGIVSDRRSQRHIVQLGQLAQEAAPAIMLGDFNMTPRHPAPFPVRFSSFQQLRRSEVEKSLSRRKFGRRIPSAGGESAQSPPRRYPSTSLDRVMRTLLTWQRH